MLFHQCFDYIRLQNLDSVGQAAAPSLTILCASAHMHERARARQDAHAVAADGLVSTLVLFRTHQTVCASAHMHERGRARQSPSRDRWKRCFSLCCQHRVRMASLILVRRLALRVGPAHQPPARTHTQSAAPRMIQVSPIRQLAPLNTNRGFDSLIVDHQSLIRHG